jgi:thiol-disulfide isomerase/thioredoxin
VVEFNDDGSFLLNLYVPYPMFLRLSTINVYACPGDTIETTVDISDPTSPKQNISGTGLSLEVNQLIEKIDKAYCELPQMENADKQTPDSLLKWHDEQVARLDDVVRLMNAGLPELEGCSPLASDILRTYIVSAHLKRICNTYFRMDKNGLDERAYWQQYFSFLAPREKYLLDNPLLMISCSDLFFTSVQDAIMDPVIRQGWQGKILPLDYNAAYVRELAENDDVTRCESQKRAMDMLHDKLNISPTNFSAQVCMLRDLFSRIDLNKDMPDRNAEYVTSTLPIITHPELMRHALLTYRKYIKENELKQVEQRPITKGDSIFQRIIEPYKGNVLYVDFWEMSCGPCRGKMLEMREEVEANKDKPVKYLYITDDTPEKCRSFLEPNNIKGEQIFVTPAEWNFLKEKFDFVALPFVMLFDKQGKRRNTVTVEQLLQE